MANIDKELEAIQNAVYGEEVRSSIYNGIKAVNDSAVGSAQVCVTKAEEASSSAANAESSASSATTKATESEQSATLAKSYATGGTGAREGEDVDNAKYYMEQAKEISQVEIATTEMAGIVKPDGNTIKVDVDGTIKIPDATKEAKGVVKLSDSEDVADSTGLALPATEKNASIEGTLAHEIAELNSILLDVGKTCCFRQSNTSKVSNGYCPVDIQEYNDDDSLYKADSNGVLISKPGTYLVVAHFHINFNENDGVKLSIKNSIKELLVSNHYDYNVNNSKQLQVTLSTIVRFTNGQERVLLNIESTNGTSYIYDWTLTNINRIVITKIK